MGLSLPFTVYVHFMLAHERFHIYALYISTSTIHFLTEVDWLKFKLCELI